MNIFFWEKTLSSIKIKSVALKNFLSVGNQIQVVNFDSDIFTLILGENLDVGGQNSRNGTGKSTIIQALCYGLFGKPLTYIKQDNLINKINNKNMMVVVDFEAANKKYRIERTRKPHSLKWYVDNNAVDSPETDEAQGENKWTQLEIEKTLGFSYELFKNIIVMSTSIPPFLELTAKGQRDLIEELLGITLLSTKAEQLKENIKETKALIRDEEVRIQVINANNEKNLKLIRELRLKENIWNTNKIKKISDIEDAISELSNIDVEKELHNFKLISEFKTIEKEITSKNKDLTDLKRTLNNEENRLMRLNSDLNKLKEQKCPTCNQVVHDESLLVIKAEKEEDSKQISLLIKEINDAKTILEQELSDLEEKYMSLGEKPTLFYSTLEEIYNHKTLFDTLDNDLKREKDQENPISSQILLLEDTGTQEIDFSEINKLSKLRDHQEFLLKLLTNKDSFIRKKIIDQNLMFLNHKLSHYLEKLNLPHKVKFENDLSTDIILFGKSYDFQQLSNGERLRICISLTCAFRDVFEHMNNKINLMFVDEILDSALDIQGYECAMDLLHEFSRKNKNVFLISHKEESLQKTNKILKVVKENSFTSFNSECV